MRFRHLGNRSAVTASLVMLTACPGPTATLEIQEPADGATITRADDVNADAAGIQVNVLVQAIGVAVGGELDLILDGSNIIGTQPVPEDGATRFPGVTIPPGTHTLTAITRIGDIQSPSITITAVDDCPSISFVTPAPNPGGVTLGPSDDTDGAACGDTFETTIVVATTAREGNEARVFVNGTPRRATTVSGGVARFEGVALDFRGAAMGNTVRVEITDPDAGSCDASFPSPIFVDCEGASCVITAPDTGSAFLSQDDDVSDEPGFQGNFEVTTDAEGASRPVRLVIDGNESEARSAIPDGVVAFFGNVPLSEGVHRVQAICEDSSGNFTRSGMVEWTVDITPCALAIVDPTEGELIIPADDIDPSTDGVQIAMAGTAGADCNVMRVGSCSGIDAVPFGSASTGWSLPVTLSSSATQTLCAQARDAAGNLATAMVGVRFDGEGPQLEIAAPATGTAFNIDGTGGRTPDLVPGNGTCEVAFDVYCTEVGTDVDLVREDTGGVLATASCVAEAGLPAPYTGRATFPSASLPSRNDGSSLSVYARQMGEREEGRSDPISLRPDCQAPALTITRPLSCPALLRPSDDESPGTSGLQYRTVVQNPSDPEADVTITIRPAGGGAPIYTETNTATATTQVFSNANYGAGGELELIATATDSAGNLGTATCMVTVEDLPTLNITAPSPGAVLDGTDDCGAAPGMQIAVSATTDAADSATATVSVNGGPAQPATISGGTISACVDVPQGRMISVQVSVTEAGRGTATASVTVTVDSMPPTNAIDDLAVSIVDRRGGVARFSWTAVDDAGGFRLESYALRCAAAPITNETEWAAATVVPILTTPGAGGAAQSADVRGFRAGVTRHCLLRGVDPAGALTPVPPTGSIAVTPEFLSQEVTASASTGFGVRIAPVGDVDGDGIDDVLIGGTDEAYLYFGSASGLGASPNVRIIGPTGAFFGQSVAGLGDINGDGLADLAVGAGTESGNRGAVYVFLGRTSWPGVIDTSADCQASLCFVSDDGASGGPDESAFFGWSVGPAGDVDGDGLMDLAIGAPGATSFRGRAYVILGRTTFVPGSVIAVPGGVVQPEGFYIEGDGSTWGQLGVDAVSIGGDATGDGRGDLLIAAAGVPPSVSGSAAFLPGRAYSGPGLVSIPVSALTRLGSGAAGSYGTAVVALGDVDGDGRMDAGVRDLGAGGQVHVFMGTTAGPTAPAAFVLRNDLSSPAGDSFGLTAGTGVHPWLMRIGDIDRDGIVDMVAGSQQTGAATVGDVRLFYRGSERTDVLRSNASVTFGPAAGEASAAFIGDVNGDGFADIGFGDPASPGGGRILIQY